MCSSNDVATRRPVCASVSARSTADVSVLQAPFLTRSTDETRCPNSRVRECRYPPLRGHPRSAVPGARGGARRDVRVPAPGNAPTPDVDAADTAPVLAHTNGGDAMSVSAPDTAPTVDSDHALGRPSAANDDRRTRRRHRLGWHPGPRRAVSRRHVQDAWWGKECVRTALAFLTNDCRNSIPWPRWPSPGRAIATRQGWSPTKP